MQALCFQSMESHPYTGYDVYGDFMDKGTKQKIAERIKTLRNKKGLTQEETAEKMGLTYNAYVKMENAYHSPSLGVLIKLSDLFDVSTDLILFGNNEKAKADVNDCDRLNNLLKLCKTENLQSAQAVIGGILDVLDEV